MSDIHKIRTENSQLWKAIYEFLFSLNAGYGDVLSAVRTLIAFSDSANLLSNPADIARFRMIVVKNFVAGFYTNDPARNDRLIVELGSHPDNARGLTATFDLPNVATADTSDVHLTDTTTSVTLRMGDIIDVVSDGDLSRVWLHLLRIGSLLRLPECTYQVAQAYTVTTEERMDEDLSGLNVSEIDAIMPHNDGSREADFVKRIANIVKGKNIAISDTTNVSQVVQELVSSPDIVNVAQEMNNAIMSGEVDIGSIVNIIQGMSERSGVDVSQLIPPGAM